MDSYYLEKFNDNAFQKLLLRAVFLQTLHDYAINLCFKAMQRYGSNNNKKAQGKTTFPSLLFMFSLQILFFIYLNIINYCSKGDIKKIMVSNHSPTFWLIFQKKVAWYKFKKPQGE